MMDILFLFILGMIPSSTTDSEFGSTDAAVEIVETNAGEEAQDPLVALLSEPEETQTNETDNNSLTDTTMTDVKLLQKGEVLDTEQVAVITTTKGEVVLRFFPEDAPKTVENFTGLAEKGYYDGIIFHRVIDGFMVQGGDPTGTGMGGESLWGGKFEDEFSDDAKNNRGSISMANAGPGTNGSQFFLNTVNNNFLDNRHAVFGEVISGMDNVDAIVSAETDARDKPLSELKMEKVEIMTFAEYKAR